MLGRILPFRAVLVVSLVGAASVGACGGTKVTFPPGGGSGTGGGTGGTGNPGNGGNDGGIVLTGVDGGTCSGFDVNPLVMQTITVGIGQTTPTVTYTATSNCNPANAAWGVDKGNVGTIPATPAASAVFTPTGTTGGVVTVSASLASQTVTRQILVKLTGTQNGPNTSPGETAQIPTGTGQLTSGGGVGGVGGDGLGTGVTDQGTIAALGAPTGNGSAQGLAFVYPYDKTVWPRGILAPLLQWTWAPPGGPAAPGDADAIKIDLATTTGSFTWSGTFGPPAILKSTGGNFIRMPIPEDVWEMATNTAGGKSDQLTVSLTVAKGGMAYGPISETWTIAPARLDGTIYYNSYGTQLAQNAGGAVGGNGQYGGAVLSIKVGDTGPKLVAGNNDPTTGCRVCHSVAAGGSRLVVEHGDNYSARSAYDLTPSGATEVPLSDTGSWFPGVYADGSLMLTPDGILYSLPNDSPALPISGLTTTPNMPMFSPDGTLVAFNPGLGQTLTVMSFAASTGAFTNAQAVVAASGSLTPGWPAFFPDSKSLVFESESGTGYDGHGSGILWTRGGATGQLAWAPATAGSAPTPLDQLNGKGYLPSLPQSTGVGCTADGNVVGTIDPQHQDDVDHNYEPTVLPVGGGGYAWVVFTSRRMYGSVATIPPFCSDPRGVNLVTNVTPKKLWVAAVDLTQAPGTDASHPAFYLPGQELLAGNSRGFWVLDPCLGDGSSCMSGDQCCNGYCEPGDGGLVCASSPPMSSCSGLGDKCTTAADCCDPLDVCLNGFCALKGPQ